MLNTALIHTFPYFILWTRPIEPTSATIPHTLPCFSSCPDSFLTFLLLTYWSFMFLHPITSHFRTMPYLLPNVDEDSFIQIYYLLQNYTEADVTVLIFTFGKCILEPFCVLAQISFSSLAKVVNMSCERNYLCINERDERVFMIYTWS